MNRGLLIALAAVAGVSMYLSMQPDNDMAAPGKQGARAHDEAGRERATGHVSNRATRAGSQPDDKDAWVSGALISGVNQWQARLAPSMDGSALAKLDPQAWGSMRPPPPPPPPKVNVVEAPPPPPMAPPFPHQWVGRFNDGPVATSASAAFGAAAQSVQRAVLSGPQSTWVVQAGDVIEGQWRVDRIQDRTMSLTYLPLKQQQTVVMR